VSAALTLKRLPTIIAAIILAGALGWLYFYAPCGVFFWNNTKDVPERCHAELGRQ
jgi:hypothetical protein